MSLTLRMYLLGDWKARGIQFFEVETGDVESER